MKPPVLQLVTVSLTELYSGDTDIFLSKHWLFHCHLGCDLIPAAHICKEEGERFWT